MSQENSSRDPWGVTIAIPAYNYAHYISETIESALAQTYPLIEIIVVDDGSTDNTREVVGRFGDSIRYVYQENQGLPASRNTGMREAKYDIFLFLDADDLLEPTMVEDCINVMKEKGDDCYVVGTKLRHIDEHGKLLAERSRVDPGLKEITARDIFLKNRFCTMALVRRKALDEVNGFDATLTSSEDRDAWLRIATVGRVFRLGKDLLRVRVHSKSMSKNAPRMFSNATRVHEKAVAAGVVKKGGILWWKARSFLYFQTAWMFHDGGQSFPAVKSLLVSLLLFPWFCAGERNDLGKEPVLFRLRALRYFLFKTRRMENDN